MRNGGCIVQQALTAETASLLKHSLSLAKRRGHAQVTPLHVAATLLSSTRESTSLFRRACLKSHSLHPNSHPLQCRALELCFNVALNRLPTIPPPSSGPLVTPNPSLSNALIAALKRAQAHQRRGCIEQQQQQQQPQHNQQQQQHNQQQQQPLLAIKVELEQLIISILDDPSVSRVMKEAGFSSTCIKNNLEEDTSCSSSSPPSVFFDVHRGINNQGNFWPTHFLKPSLKQNSCHFSSQNEDIKLVIDVLLGKNKKKSNPVVVGDSVSYTEGLVTELMGKVEKGDVPEELRSVKFVNLHFSAVQLKFMSTSDVEANISDLRKKVSYLTSDGRSVIIFLGDLKWAVNDDNEGPKDVDTGDYRAVRHVINELARLQSEWRWFHGCSLGNRVWLLATATYQTYMRCQMRQPCLEVQWGLHAVSVPSGGLALSLHVPSYQELRGTATNQDPLQAWQLKPFYDGDEQDKLICCAECISNFEKESLILKSNYKSDTNSSNGSVNLSFWFKQPQKHNNHREDVLVELRKKWSSLCQRLHHSRQNLLFPSFDGKSYNNGSLHPSLPTTKPFKQNSFLADSNPCASTKFSVEHRIRISDFLNRSASVVRETPLQEQYTSQQWISKDHSDVQIDTTDKQDSSTTLALGSTPFSESSSPEHRRKRMKIEPVELCQRLKENIPWQSEPFFGSIAEALLDEKPDNHKGTWFLIRGSDRIGKRRLSMVITDYAYRHGHSLACISAGNQTNTHIRSLREALQKDENCVVLIEEIDLAETSFMKFLSEMFQTGSLAADTDGRRPITISTSNAVFILITKSDDSSKSTDDVIELRLRTETTEVDAVVTNSNPKRKAEEHLSPNKPKNPRTTQINLDLNIKADEDSEDINLLGDVTDPIEELHSSDKFLSLISTCLVLDSCNDHLRLPRMHEYYLSRTNQVLGDESSRCLSIDMAVVEEMVSRSDSFTNDLFEKWVDEVLRRCLVPLVKDGGKGRLCLEGKLENSLRFEGSCLPSRIHVD